MFNQNCDSKVQLATSTKPVHQIEKLFYLVGLIFLLLLQVYLGSELQGVSLAILSNLVSGCVVVALLITIRVSSRGLWSAASMYLGVFCLFHFGLTLVYGLGLSIQEDFDYEIRQWFYDSAYTPEALLLTNLGLIAFTLGVLLTSFLNVSKPKPARIGQNLDPILGWVGFFLTAISIGAWFWLVLKAGGVKLLTSSYETFLQATEKMELHWVYYGIGLGMIFLAVASPSNLRRMGLALFLVWAVIALPLGLRGEVLFPAFSALVVSAKLKIPISTKKFLAIAVCVLSLVSVMRGVRQVGLDGMKLSEVSLSPVDALVEMGCSLRPVCTVVTWTSEGEDFLYGASYWAPFDRSLALVIPGSNRLDAEDDDRIMNILMNKRVGPIGFSPIAEAFFNFGVWGVFLVLFLTGLVLGWMDTWAATPFYRGILGVFFLPLLIQIRNSFVAVPFQILAGVALLVCIYLLAKMVEQYVSIRLPQPTHSSFKQTVSQPVWSKILFS